MHKLSHVHILIPEKDERSGTRPDRLAICEITFLIYEYSFGTLMLRRAICPIFYQRLLLLGKRTVGVVTLQQDGAIYCAGNGKENKGYDIEPISSYDFVIVVTGRR